MREDNPKVGKDLFQVLKSMKIGERARAQVHQLGSASPGDAAAGRSRNVEPAGADENSDE